MSKYKTPVTPSGQLLIFALLVGAGYLIGVMSHDTAVQAGVRRDQPAQQQFQTGDQRCEVVLREISATLGKVAERLDRMEKLANQLVNRSSGQLPGETR